MSKKLFFIKAIIFIVLPCMGMNDEAQPQILDKLEELFSAKHKITQENFDKAMNAVRNRPAGGEYLAEKISSKLSGFVNQELSTDEWGQEVQKAYYAVLKDVGGFTAKAMEMTHPIEDIIIATIWAIPS